MARRSFDEYDLIAYGMDEEQSITQYRGQYEMSTGAPRITEDVTRW
eukprot:CAMPEP_0201725280 /NCGR_PEP_ID=MMETSP0593-20130828/8727_1 /ASSEMBLY_ACC=CAM_ASM_000672 /TAXON_ID=267983 /ORGANISM="Skeletonema japonicum, Strain CCMP2506" /LENGTH=45 /DNA_ID= /DNA_START= /DNA_END= /DNA_ORIENTATION=